MVAGSGQDSANEKLALGAKGISAAEVVESPGDSALKVLSDGSNGCRRKSPGDVIEIDGRCERIPDARELQLIPRESVGLGHLAKQPNRGR